MDFNGSFLARVRDLAGANPIILVVTKVSNFTYLVDQVVTLIFVFNHKKLLG